MKARKFSPKQIILFLNSFSIVVAVGAYVMYHFMSFLFAVPASSIVAFCLATTTWLIYTADHLLDAVVLHKPKAALRHALHWEFRKPLMVVGTLLIPIVIFLALRNLSKPEIQFCLGLAGITALHFLINFFVRTSVKKKLYLKEVVIAFVVASAFTLLPAISEWSSVDKQLVLAAFICMFSLNLANLFLFSMYDVKSDLQSGLDSIVTVYGTKATRKSITIVLVISLCSAASIYFLDASNLASSIVLILMGFVLWMVKRFSSFFSKNERYRFWGDLIFVLPGFVLPFL